MADLVVTKSPERGRYEAHLDGELVGFSTYEAAGDVVSFTHARVYTPHGGQGFASAMAQVSLDDVRAAGQKARPVCSFYRWYIEKNPQYADLLAS